MSSTPAVREPPWRAFVKKPVNWLLAAAPAAIVLDAQHAPAALVFLMAGLALVPLATLIVHSTEEIAARTGPAIGGLLNATFGNLPELIIAFVALRAGLLDMVRGSLIGAMLANLLLAMGIAFILGGRGRHVQEYNPAAARTYGSILLLAALSLIGPASFHRFLSETAPRHAEALDTGVCIVMLVLYALYLVFMLRTHPDFFSVIKGAEEAHEPKWGMGRAVTTLIAASVGAAFMSEVLVGAAEETGHALGMSTTFIGIILLAILGGAAESGAAIAMAKKDKMDLSVGIAMGSSIQIALFVTPLLVLSSAFVAPARLTLSFTRAEIGALFLGVLVAITIAGDGRANWFKGAQLVGFYAIIAALFYLLPEMGVMSAGKRERVLDPVERMSEVLFGLIMVLSFTCSLSVATAGREEVGTVLIGAVGCNLAWGLIDAVMYLMMLLIVRGRTAAIGRAVRASANPEHGRNLIAEALPEPLDALFDAPAVESARAKLSALPELPVRARLVSRDWLGACGVFLLVFLSTFPVVIPFLLFTPLHTAMRVSNGVAIVMLYGVGHALGRHAGLSPLRTGLAMVGLGILLVGLTIALGG